MQDLERHCVITPDIVIEALMEYESIMMRVDDLRDEDKNEKIKLSKRYKNNMESMCKSYGLEFNE